jgi:exosome complex RNA-binding protein Csl4
MKLTKLLMALLLPGLLALTGCPALDIPGGLGGLGGANVNNDVVGEVQFVDSRGRTIEIRTDSGQKSVLRYDDNTQVVYRQKNYSVANLERGDYVAARVQQERDGSYFTTGITVRETAQDRGVGASTGNQFNRLEGRVENVDARRGTFEIRDQRNRIVVVSVAFNAPRTITDRFNRLRNGDYVRIEGRGTGADRFDLENFL